MQPFDLSFIQLRILSNFIRGNDLTYSQGRPRGVTNDLYKYHLGFLIKKGFIEKTDDKYLLTEKGKGTIQNFDVYGTPRHLFKVSVLVYLTKEEGGKKYLLMQKRLRHPYFGDIETVSGKINPGEPVEKAGLRKLKEETGLSGDIIFTGVVRKIRTSNTGRIFEDTLYHVCFAKNPKGELKIKNEFGENFWADISSALKLVQGNKTYSKYTSQIIKKSFGSITKPPFFYLTENTKLKGI